MEYQTIFAGSLVPGNLKFRPSGTSSPNPHTTCQSHILFHFGSSCQHCRPCLVGTCTFQELSLLRIRSPRFGHQLLYPTTSFTFSFYLLIIYIQPFYHFFKTSIQFSNSNDLCSISINPIPPNSHFIAVNAFPFHWYTIWLPTGEIFNIAGLQPGAQNSSLICLPK